LKLGATICQPPGSFSLLTITAPPACRANSSPGWRASGAGWHPEDPDALGAVLHVFLLERAVGAVEANRLHWLALVVADLAGSYNAIGIRRWCPRGSCAGCEPVAVVAGMR
jgi:hypothetical protein